MSEEKKNQNGLEKNMDDEFTELNPSNQEAVSVIKEENQKEEKITELTPEILDKIPEYKEKCVKDLYSGKEWENFDPHKSIAYIEKIYELADQKNPEGGVNKPVIIFADSPDQYKEYFRIIHNEKALEYIYRVYQAKNGMSEENFTYEQEQEILDNIYNVKLTKEDQEREVKWHYLYLCSIYHRIYLTWYKFIQDEFKVDHENKEILDWLYKNANNNISRCYFTTMFCLVLKTPKYIKRNDTGFHSIDGPAIEWPDYPLYYINGRRIDEHLFKSVVEDTFTFKEFLAIEDEDTKAVVITLIIEKFGNEKLMEFLNAKIIDEQEVSHKSGHTEVIKLWHTNEKYEFNSDIEGNSNQPFAWLELVCPSSDAVYLIETSAHFKDAVEAAKFHRPQAVTMEIPYSWDLFNS